MHPLLYRFLLSSAGATAATSAIVLTAENRDRDLRRPKRPAKKKSGKKGAKKGAKSKTAKKAAQKRRENASADPMSRARRELASGSEPLAFDAFWANIKNTPQAVADVVSGKAAREKEEKRQKRADRRAKMSPAERRADDRRRKRKRRAKERAEGGEDWGIGASIRAEVKKQVKDAATETIRDHAEAATDRLKDGADIVKEKTADAAKKLAEAAPDVAASAKSVADGASRFTKALAESVPDSTDGAKKGLNAIGRWVEGPGSQKYEEDEAPKQLGGVVKTTAVSAKLDDDGDGVEDVAAPAASEVSPAPSSADVAGRSIVQRRLEAARRAAERGSTTPRPSSESRVRAVRKDAPEDDAPDAIDDDAHDID